LLNFTQDFFQRVECEASVQLMRLKNAKLTTPPSAEQSGGAADDKMVDTAKWLHTMTDLVMSLQGSGISPLDVSPPASSRSVAARAAASSEACTPPQMSLNRGGRSSPGLASHGGRTPAGSAALSSARGGSAISGNGSSGVRLVSPRPPSPPPQASQQAALLRDMGASTKSSGSAATSVGFASSAASGAGVGTLGYSGSSAGSVGGAGSATIGLGRPKPRPPQGFGDAASDFGGRRGRGIDNTLEFGGLALGKGTWANAYRQAWGERRDALRLLCSTGIVTERELADDLTVISEEHIEECVSIAGEILRKWPPEHGPPPVSEAKAFFEERLAALYMKRAPSPF